MVYMTLQLKIFVYSPSNYRLSVLNIDTKHDSLQVHWHPSCEEIVSYYDVPQVTFVYMISSFNLTVMKMGSKKYGTRYVISESWKLDSLHVMKFKYWNSKCGWSISYKHDKKYELMRSNCLCLCWLWIPYMTPASKCIVCGLEGYP